MGVSTSKSKTKSTADPYAAAQPSINAGLTANQQVFDANQPRLNQMSQTAQDAYNQIAPGAFLTSPYVKSAQEAAQGIFSGNQASPGQATYASLMGQNNPALANLTSLANNSQANPAGDYIRSLLGQTGGAGDNALSQIANGGYNNPADAYSRAVTGGQYLNNQPSASLYGDIMSADYLKGNPYLDSIIGQTNESVTNQANRRLAASGLGSGVSSNFADLLSKNLADNEGRLRYTNYNDAANRQLTAAGQSDAAFSAERNRMQDSNGLISANYNQGQANALSAAQALSTGSRADREAQLAAANSLGSLFNTGQTNQLAAANSLGSLYNSNAQTQLGAAQAADASRNSQTQQQLAALGLTGALSDAQYAGVNPALNLLTASANLPYAGVSALAGNINNLAGRYGTTTATTKSSPGLFDQIMGGLDFGAGFIKGLKG